MQNDRVLAPEDLSRPPTYATRRDPSRRTRGGKVAVLAAALGRPLKAHQQYIADVATELNPPGSRLRFRYQLVIVSLPRQTGKTTLMRPIFLERVLTRPQVQAFMTAQSGKDASARWEDLVSDLATSSVFRSMMQVKRGKGDQRCTWPNASTIAPFTPDKESLHGYSPEIVFVDEGWAFDAIQGADLMKAIRPAQITKVDRQLYIVSAAGDANSEWWTALMALGRASLDDPDTDIAFFDWSMDPSADPADPASWEFHPGLDGLITVDDLAAEYRANALADFLRGFMNLPTTTAAGSVVDLTAWDTHARSDLVRPPMDRLAIGYDVAVDRSSASVWSAWIEDDVPHLHVVRTAPGITWLAPFVEAFAAKHSPAVVAADDGGPARMVTDQLRRAGVRVETLPGRDFGTAWTEFKTAAPTVVHDGTPELRAALAAVVERKVGEQLGPARHASPRPIDPAIAAMVATWHAARIPTSIPIF